MIVSSWYGRFCLLVRERSQSQNSLIIIQRCGGMLTGYYLPKEGANDYAIALIDFESLAAYELYRTRLAADPDAQANRQHAQDTRCILAERRSFLRKV